MVGEDVTDDHQKLRSLVHGHTMTEKDGKFRMNKLRKEGSVHYCLPPGAYRPFGLTFEKTNVRSPRESFANCWFTSSHGCFGFDALGNAPLLILAPSAAWGV